MNNSPICKTFVLSNYFFRDNILLTKPLKSNKNSLKTNRTPYC